MFYAQHVDMSTTPNVIARCTAEEQEDARTILRAMETLQHQQKDGDTHQ